MNTSGWGTADWIVHSGQGRYSDEVQGLLVAFWKDTDVADEGHAYSDALKQRYPTVAGDPNAGALVTAAIVMLHGVLELVEDSTGWSPEDVFLRLSRPPDG